MDNYYNRPAMCYRGHMTRRGHTPWFLDADTKHRWISTSSSGHIYICKEKTSGFHCHSGSQKEMHDSPLSFTSFLYYNNAENTVPACSLSLSLK